MKICYGSYNEMIEEEKRAALARAISGRLAKNVSDITGTPTEVVCCIDKAGIAAAVKDGCDVIITEPKLKMPEGGKLGDDGIGYGTIKEWNSLPGVRCVILLFPEKDRPAVATGDDGVQVITAGTKVVELYRRGYYNGVFLRDLTGERIVEIVNAGGRKSAEAQSYYGVTEDMLGILLARSEKKEKKDKEKKGVFGGLFGGRKEKETADHAGDVSPEKVETNNGGAPVVNAPKSSQTETVSSNNNKESNDKENTGTDGGSGDPVKESENVASPNEKNPKGDAGDENAQGDSAAAVAGSVEDSAAGDSGNADETDPDFEREQEDVLSKLLSGGSEAFLGNDENEAADESGAEGLGGFSFDVPSMDVSASAKESGFNFSEEAVSSVKTNAGNEGVTAERPAAVVESANTEAKTTGGPVTDNPVMEDGDVQGQDVKASAFSDEPSGFCTGKISRCLNGGATLTIDLYDNPPDDITRYAVAVMYGSGRGRVVNGRYQSATTVVSGYCVKCILNRTLIVDVNPEEAVSGDPNGMDCMLMFTLLHK